MANRRLVRSLVIVTLLLMGTALTTANIEASSYVRILKPPSLSYSPLSIAEETSLAQQGVTILDDYGPFAIGSAADGIDLSTVGTYSHLVIAAEPDAYRVDAGTVSLDVRSPGAALTGVPAELQVADYPGATGLYLVKLRGPLRPGWLDPLTKSGARIVQYVHKNSYIVAAPTGLSRLQGLVTGPIIYVGVYQPFFKLSPTLATGSKTSAVVRILFDRGQDLQSAGALLRGLDAAAQVVIPAITGDATATAVVSAAGVRALAADPSVIAMDEWLGGGPSDERVDQVIAVHRDANGLPQQAQQYKTWLAGQCSGCGDLSGEIVDVLDSGIATYHADLPAGRVTSPRLYFGIPSVQDFWYHGTMVSGLIAGDPSQAGGSGRTDADGFYYDMGVAPTVKIHPSRITNDSGNTQGYIDALTLDTILANARNDGARFQNFSWNETAAPGYTALAREYDRLVRDATLTGTPDKAITVVISAGNNFTHSPDPSDLWVASPATAKNVIAVGATGILRGPGAGGTLGGNCDTTQPQPPRQVPITIKDIAYFSRSGISQNLNRFKPDIYAPGDAVSSARGTGINGFSMCAGQAGNPLHLPLPDGPNHPGNATSFSAPVVTGVAVLAKKKILSDRADHICEMPPDHPAPCPSPALIKAAILSTTETNSSGGYNYCRGFSNTWEPTPYQGWGRVALSSLLADPVSKAYLDEDHGSSPINRFVQSGVYKNFTFTVADPSKAISAVLVTTDAPANVNATNVTVNEVDMYVMQGGYVYCDGQYGGQYATRSTGCWFPDSSNNVKRARIAPNSFTGQFTIQVVAGAINANAVPGRDGGAPNQDWALYVYNAIQN